MMMNQSVMSVGRLTSMIRPSLSVLFVRNNSSIAAVQEDVANAKPYEDIPGPKPLPFLGNSWRFIPFIGPYSKMSATELANYLETTYGSICKLRNLKGRRDLIFLFEPKDFETVFRNEGPWPFRSSLTSVLHYRKVERRDFFKGIEGVALTNGEQWQDFRSRVNQPMMQPRNTKLYVGPIDEVTRDLVDRMREIRNDKGELPPDFIEYLMRWALESISLIALDTRLGCLDRDYKENSEAQKMIDGTHVFFQALAELETKPSFIHFSKRKIYKQMVEVLNYSTEVSMKYISQAMERIKTKVDKGEHELSVLEYLLLKNEDPMIAIVMALDMMLAGIDTTSHATATLLHYLAKNQDKQERLFQEVEKFLQPKDKPVTAQDLDKMKYLKACVKESMRLSPTAPGNMRQTMKDIVLSNYHVPKGVDVMMNNHHATTKEEHFPQANKFIPERWLKGSEEQQNAHPFAFMPFGFGPRMCIGRRFAELEIETLVCKVIRNFRLEYDNELELELFAINMVKNPLNFKLEDRP